VNVERGPTRAGQGEAWASGAAPPLAVPRACLVVSRARPCFGTLVTVSVRCDAALRPAALHAIDRAFEACAAVHVALSAHDPCSDLGRIARAGDGAVLEVSPHTVAVLGLARHWHRESGGRFDPAVGRRLAADGLRPGLDAAARGRLVDVERLDDRRVRVRRAAALDLGGLAKGYGVDRAIDALREAGVAAALVNAGGDLRAFGRAAWPLAVRMPSSPTRAVRIGAGPGRALRGRTAFAMAGSGLLEAGPAARHATLVEPRLGRRRRVAPLGCTVIAPDAATADALTKLVMLSRRWPRRVLQRARARAWVHRGGATS
jgi:thiamine biosynthesis lipoprotein